MALRMAIERPREIAGVAAIVAAMPAKSQCAEPRVSVPVLFMNGTEDPILPFPGGPMRQGRGSVLSAEQSVEIWRRLAGASLPAKAIALPDISPDDSSRVERRLNVTPTASELPAQPLGSSSTA